MPRYNALDLSVRLHVWNPEKETAAFDEKGFPRNPSIGHAIEEVSEEYFKGRPVIDFVGQTPAFFINAGRNLFFQKDQSVEIGKQRQGPNTGNDKHDRVRNDIGGSPYERERERDPSGQESSTAPLTGVQASADPHDDDTESPLSSVPSNFDQSPPFMSDERAKSNVTSMFPSKIHSLPTDKDSNDYKDKR